MSFDNPHFLTVEDYNSIVSDLAHGWIDYYDVTIDDMVDGEEKVIDFVEVRRYSDYDDTCYEVVVNNSLWTGGFYIENLNESNVSFQGSDLIIRGLGLSSFRLVLELSNDFYYDTPQFISNKMVLPKITVPYYEDIVATGRIIDFNGAGVNNVQIYYNNLNNNVASDNNGYYQIPFSKSKPGKENVKISLLKSTSPRTYYHYYFPINRLKVNVPVELVTKRLYKDGKQKINFKFVCNQNIAPNELFNENEIYLIVNNTKIPLNSHDGYNFSFWVDLRDYFDDTIKFKLVMSGNDYIEPITENYTLNLIYYLITNYRDLKSEIENPNGIRTIRVNTYLVGNDSIVINREIHIIGRNLDAGDNFIAVRSKPTFIVNAKLTIENCEIRGIIQNKGSEVNINNCIFDNNVSYNDISSVLYCNIENEDDKFTTSIKNSSFSLSNKTYIYHGGDLKITDSSFEKTSSDGNNVAFINQVAGSCNLHNNTFNLDIDTNNIDYGCVMFRIALKAKLNGVLGKDLKNNGVFPLLNNRGDIDIEYLGRTVMCSAIPKKCVNWVVEDTNTIYSNNMEVNDV